MSLSTNKDASNEATTTSARASCHHQQSPADSDETRSQVGGSSSFHAESSRFPSHRQNRFHQLRKDALNRRIHRSFQSTTESNDQDEKKSDVPVDNHNNAISNRYTNYYSSTSLANSACDPRIVTQCVAAADVRDNGSIGESSSEVIPQKEEQGCAHTSSRSLMRRHLVAAAIDHRRSRTLQQASRTISANLSESKSSLTAVALPSLETLDKGKRNDLDVKSYLSHPPLEDCGDEGEADVAIASLETKPQHCIAMTTECSLSSTTDRYYRVAFRGVVALLTEPHPNASRSGTYLGYGEIFASRLEVAVDSSAIDDNLYANKSSIRNGTTTTTTTTELPDPSNHGLSSDVIDSPPRSVFSHHSIGSVSSLETLQSRSTISAYATSTATYGPKQRQQQATSSPPPLTAPTTNFQVQTNIEHQQEGSGQPPMLPENRAIRVDRVLTGGYAVDGLGGLQTSTASLGQTINVAGGDSPQRSVVGYRLPVVDSPTGHNSSGERVSHEANLAITSDKSSGFGYLFFRRKNEQIVERIHYAPIVEEGTFHYRVVSTTPLPIFAGPSLDAPRVKAMALPGTIHDVSLRLRFDNCTEQSNTNTQQHCIWFLRLSHRRGWVLDKKRARKDTASERWRTVMRELSNPDNDLASVTDDSSIVSSVASSSALTPTAAGARQRHRPPRKRRDAAPAPGTNNENPLGRLNAARPPTTPIKSTSGSVNHQHNNTMTPSSTVSILSDESSVDRSGIAARNGSVPTSPDFSQTSTIASTTTSTVESTSQTTQLFLLIRVTAPRGLKILDAPQLQVNNLIRGKSTASSFPLFCQPESFSTAAPLKSRHSIFQTMSGRLGSSTGVTNNSGHSTISGMSSGTRVLPCGTLFEASKQMENTGVYSQGAGLIRLSDGSGWAVVPRKEDLDHQYRSYSRAAEAGSLSAFEEVGRAIVDCLPVMALDSKDRSVSRTKWVRVVSRTGVLVSCPPPFPPLDELSPSSLTSSAITASNHGQDAHQDSDLASSVASTFVDAMLFRSPKRKGEESFRKASSPDRQIISSTIPSGMCVEVENFTTGDHSLEYVRLVGGQGWIPLNVNGKEGCVVTPIPQFRFGSFWFRVRATRGIKVRLGPSKKAPSIKSEDGIHFRFECGEFLRASEVMTIFSDQGKNKEKPSECFAKLYRNRHARLHQGHEEYRSLQSLSAQSEWVHVFSDEDLYLEQCNSEPHIEREKQGWRYCVVSEEGISVRRGPSFSSETTGVKLLKDHIVMITERVSPAGEKITWLRLHGGEGWLHDIDDLDNHVVVAQSPRHRPQDLEKNDSKATMKPQRKQEEEAYNTLISRLFHSNASTMDSRPYRNTTGFL